MATDCEGTWEKSMLNNTIPDGEIEIIEIADGDFIGTHFKSNKPLVGHCTEGASPHIRFTVIDYDNLCIYTYEGDVVLQTGEKEEPIFRIQNGKRFTKCTITKDRKKILVGPDDWTAEKPT